MLSVGCSLKILSALALGANASIGGINGPNLGMHLNLGGEPFQFTFATNGLTALASRYAVRGVDIQIGTSFFF